MADGLFTGQGRQEQLQQAELIRHRLLRINTSAEGYKNGQDSSSYASVNPNDLNLAVNYSTPEGGPHFVMSPRTPDDSKTYGFEFALSRLGITGAEQVIPLVGGYTVTWWELLGTSFDPSGAFQPIWASFASRTGVNDNELYHTFDVNATALRIQITNVQAVPAAGIRGSILLFFSEL